MKIEITVRVAELDDTESSFECTVRETEAEDALLAIGEVLDRYLPGGMIHNVAKSLGIFANCNGVNVTGTLLELVDTAQRYENECANQSRRLKVAP